MGVGEGSVALEADGAEEVDANDTPEVNKDSKKEKEPVVPFESGADNALKGKEKEDGVEVDGEAIAELGKTGGAVSENGDEDEEDGEPADLSESFFKRGKEGIDKGGGGDPEGKTGPGRSEEGEGGGKMRKGPKNNFEVSGNIGEVK